MEQFFTFKRMIIIGVLVLVGVVAGRLIVRAVINFLVGGTLFGGDFL